MAYLEEFSRQIDNKDFTKFFQLWEEYCTSDIVEAEEFIEILEVIKDSEFALKFGKFADTGLTLWETFKDPKDSYNVLKAILDVQTSNSPQLAETAFNLLKQNHGENPRFQEFIRLVGLRNRLDFQHAISSFDLLLHMEKGNCVFHNGGWGTGEIMAVSFIREELTLEFENVRGRKPVTFANAFKTFIPLDPKSFRSRRFVGPDSLEHDARKDPVAIVKLLLEDLGPKTAADIKDEMCELVIPEPDWSKWWQSARARIKKCTLIETPNTLRKPFRLHQKEVTHEERLHQAIHKKSNVGDIIQTTYNFIRDLPNMLKKEEVRQSVQEKIVNLLSDPSITESEKMEVSIFMEYMLDQPIEGKELKTLVTEANDIEDVINNIDIIAFKKRALVAVKNHRDDWVDLFLNFLISLDNNPLRDYVAKELNESSSKERFEEILLKLKRNPEKYPGIFVWYFQKIIKAGGEKFPFSDKEGQCKLLESLLIVMHKMEHDPAQRDLVKKIYTTLIAKRYLVIRKIIEGTSIDFIKEFLLLSLKTHVFTDHDKKILQSLAEVVHPTLGKSKKKEIPDLDPNIIWTTEEGYRKTHERIKQISTIEMIETAKEIETAREHGDLRENSEYKFALEKRARLQNEMRQLSQQINQARVVTELDISPDKVGVGCIVDIQDSQGNLTSYTILGPWDADVDKNILSVQSQFARNMIGCQLDQEFDFKDEQFKVVGFKSIFEKG